MHTVLFGRARLVLLFLPTSTRCQQHMAGLPFSQAVPLVTCRSHHLSQPVRCKPLTVCRRHGTARACLPPLSHAAVVLRAAPAGQGQLRFVYHSSECQLNFCEIIVSYLDQGGLLAGCGRGGLHQPLQQVWWHDTRCGMDARPRCFVQGLLQLQTELVCGNPIIRQLHGDQVHWEVCSWCCHAGVPQLGVADCGTSATLRVDGNDLYGCAGGRHCLEGCANGTRLQFESFESFG